MEEVYRDIKPTSYSLSNSLSLSFCLHLFLNVPPPLLCFYDGIIISLSRPLLFRLELNNKFQDRADAAFLPAKVHSVDSTETLFRNNTRQQQLLLVILCSPQFQSTFKMVCKVNILIGNGSCSGFCRVDGKKILVAFPYSTRIYIYF